MEKFSLNNGLISYEFENRSFDEFHGITLSFITLDEERGVVSFIEHIKPYVKSVVMVDGGSGDRTVELAKPLVDIMAYTPFTGHFGNQKNSAISMSRTDWILLLDPDERLTEKAIKMLPEFINQDEFDCYSFPRREYLDGEENTRPYPDYQDRLFRAYCRLIRPVHEEIVGYKNKKILPINSGLDIIHSKELKRHVSRNHGYGFFEIKHKNEIGMPGFQTKETFTRRYPSLCVKISDGSKL